MGTVGPWIKVNWAWSSRRWQRLNIDILGISELKWTGMGEFNSDDHCIYFCDQEFLRRNGFKLGLSSVWTENFQMYNLVFKEAEEPQNQTANFQWIMEKAKEFQKKSISASLTTLKALNMWTTTNCWKILQEMWVLHDLICLLRNL